MIKDKNRGEKGLAEELKNVSMTDILTFYFKF